MFKRYPLQLQCRMHDAHEDRMECGRRHAPCKLTEFLEALLSLRRFYQRCVNNASLNFDSSWRRSMGPRTRTRLICLLAQVRDRLRRRAPVDIDAGKRSRTNHENREEKMLALRGAGTDRAMIRCAGASMPAQFRDPLRAPPPGPAAARAPRLATRSPSAGQCRSAGPGRLSSQAARSRWRARPRGARRGY